MKVFFYQLKGLKERHGALLSINGGYCDIHPWHELGDLPLKEQLSLLKKGILTPLTKRSLYFAEIDAKARQSGCNLFKGLQMPDSHWLMQTAPIPEGITTVKIKAGLDTDINKIILDLPKHLKIRLDFNNKLTFETFSKKMLSIEEEWHRIDFVEDPYPYHAELWKQSPVPIAGDFQKEKGPIAIVKPAVEDTVGFNLETAVQDGKAMQDFESEGFPVGAEHSQKVKAAEAGKPYGSKDCVALPSRAAVSRFNNRVIITSYLDHPLGQLAAAYTAATMPCKEVCGLLSHAVYETNAFSERLGINGAKLAVPTSGTGFGFDDLLENLPWIPL